MCVFVFGGGTDSADADHGLNLMDIDDIGPDGLTTVHGEAASFNDTSTCFEQHRINAKTSTCAARPLFQFRTLGTSSVAARSPDCELGVHGTGSKSNRDDDCD